MKKQKMFTRILAMLLTIVMLACSQGVSVLADTVKENNALSETYLSDIRMFYAESEDKGREYCEKEGYIFCPTDLMEGTDSVVKAYFGYKTTKDAGDAITDLTLLDMKNSNYKEMSYKEYLDKHMGDFADQATRLMSLTAEFRRLYAAGSPGALMAYDSLNMFYIDEAQSHTAKGNLLGEYLLNEADPTFFEKFIQRGNAMVLSSIINNLGTAVSDYNDEGTTWADRAKTSAIEGLYKKADSAMKTQYDTWYKGPALEFIQQAQIFAEQYREAKERQDKYGDTFGYGEEDGIYADSTAGDLIQADVQCKIPEYVNALLLYDMLDAYVWQEEDEQVVTDEAYLLEEGEDEEEATVIYTERKTLAEFVLEVADDKNAGLHPEMLYPIIEAMTAPQRIALEECGLTILAKGLHLDKEYGSRRDEYKADVEKRLKEHGYSEGRMWLWDGVDQGMYNQRVVETSDKIEIEKSGAKVIESTNAAAREAASDRAIALQIIDISTLAISGSIMIAQAIAGTTLWQVGMACYMMSSLAITASMAGYAILYGLLGTLCCCLFLISIVILIASLAYLVYTILDACGVFDDDSGTDYSSIPGIMFHVRQNSTGTYGVRYDVVRSNVTPAFMSAIVIRETSVETLWDMFETYMSGGDINENVEKYYRKRIPTDAADIAAYQGLDDRWLSPYITKSPAAGSPVIVGEDGSFFKLQMNDYQVPAGYKAVSLVSGNSAADIHSVEIDEKTGTPAYLFLLKQQAGGDQQPDVPAVNPDQPKKPAEVPEGGEVISSDLYVTRVRMAHADSRENAQNILKKDGFVNIIDVNLTPYDGYTFLGYQLGGEANALTDIRVSTIGTDPIVYGEASYGRAGLAGSDFTPDGVALYATTSKSAGSPIIGITVENHRLELGSGAEPVCLFSGGNAVDFSQKWSDNQLMDVTAYGIPAKSEPWLTRQDDPVNGLYIYFWPKVQFTKENSDSEKPPYVAGFSYFMALTEKGEDQDFSDRRFGSNPQFMQTFAKENGFELIQKDGSPLKVMPETAGTMNSVAHWVDKEGGVMVNWTYDVYHYLYEGTLNNFSDKALGFYEEIKDVWKEQNVGTEMYFGVSYTYNPYRAITGVSGLITPFTETAQHSLRYTGLKTPAGTMQVSTVNIQGNPITNAGICYGYYNIVNMRNALYTNSDAHQSPALPWITANETEVLTRYLLTNGPVDGLLPIKRDDLAFVTSANPGEMQGYVPLCDMRTPGDYEHPMNLALDTSNQGAEFLYLYLKKSAGGRRGAVTSDQNEYQKKHYVAAIICGTGKTPEEAVKNLYDSMAAQWTAISKEFPDVAKIPLVTELDEVLPVDLSDQEPWYDRGINDAAGSSPKDNEWVYGNEAANLRWGHDQFTSSWNVSWKSETTADDGERLRDSAYIGVIRTNYANETVNVTEKDKNGKETTRSVTVYPAHGMLKYYNDNSGPSVLHVGSIACTLAGGPIKSAEGTYYLYYSTNSATASFSAPITEIDVSEEEFINGYNSSFSCSEADRKNNSLPEYSQLRMRTDEQLYIHTKYDMADLPYIEHVYIGIGSNKKEAYADLIGTTNANAAAAVNCNYNSFSDKYIAIGYRRTKDSAGAVRDLMLYAGNNPLDSFETDGYSVTVGKSKGQVVTKFNPTKVTYRLVKHNLAVGAETRSLNEGNGEPGLYLYMAKSDSRIAYSQSFDTEIFPVRNLAFSYGDISPAHATTGDLARVYGGTLHGMKEFDELAYSDPSWEYVLGVEGDSPAAFRLDGSTGFAMGLNYGILPTAAGNFHSGDRRIQAYMDRGRYDQPDIGNVKYVPRKNAVLTDAGYYSEETNYGMIQQR